MVGTALRRRPSSLINCDIWYYTFMGLSHEGQSAFFLSPHRHTRPYERIPHVPLRHRRFFSKRVRLRGAPVHRSMRKANCVCLQRPREVRHRRGKLVFRSPLARFCRSPVCVGDGFPAILRMSTWFSCGFCLDNSKLAADFCPVHGGKLAWAGRPGQ